MLPVAEVIKTWLARRNLTFFDKVAFRPGHVRLLPRIDAGARRDPGPASNIVVDFGVEVVPPTVTIGIEPEFTVEGLVRP